jgi:putative chitinase
MFDRKKFFEKFFYAIHPMFGGFAGARGPDQIKGLDFILDMWLAKYQERTPPTQFAYVLATTYLETDRRMQPIREYGNPAYFTRMYDITGARADFARRNGNIFPGDGAKFCGRGYVQLTWRPNYARATGKLRDLGVIARDVDFVANPDLVMQPEYAIVILFEGMEGGWFSGRSLDQEIDGDLDGDEHADFLRARRIINGTDRAATIADAADRFLAAIKAAS